MAKALVCNLCAAKGKPAFATLHVEGKFGIGKRARQFEADFCDEDGRIFTELVSTGITGKTPQQPGRKPTRGGLIATRDDIRLPMLAVIGRATEPLTGPAIIGHTRIPGPVGTQKKVLFMLRAEGLVHMEGTRNSARYTLTTNGKRSLGARHPKEKAPAAAATSAPSEKRAARRLRSPRRRHRR